MSSDDVFRLDPASFLENISKIDQNDQSLEISTTTTDPKAVLIILNLPILDVPVPTPKSSSSASHSVEQTTTIFETLWNHCEYNHKM